MIYLLTLWNSSKNCEVGSVESFYSFLTINRKQSAVVDGTFSLIADRPDNQWCSSGGGSWAYILFFILLFIDDLEVEHCITLYTSRC